MNVELIDSMGTDLTVVNAARVSFGKKKTKFTKGDERLINYLASHNHWTPFGHCTLQYHIKAPMFVARQLGKHQVGLVWNEVSRRYVDSKPHFYVTDKWRSKAENKKQGSGDELVELQGEDYDHIQTALMTASDTYTHLLLKGVAPEQARMVLPQATYTEWYWTGSLYAFARICNLRLTEDAQEETKIIARKISTSIQNNFPISHKYLI